ncbi:hypothetical protein ONZ45_g17137 [Pleurotus djamor]|nr:hypothetical protein ONZ45_g17137 [Pleurotus djamor]
MQPSVYAHNPPSASFHYIVLMEAQDIVPSNLPLNSTAQIKRTSYVTGEDGPLLQGNVVVLKNRTLPFFLPTTYEDIIDVVDVTKDDIGLIQDVLPQSFKAVVYEQLGDPTRPQAFLYIPGHRGPLIRRLNPRMPPSFISRGSPLLTQLDLRPFLRHYDFGNVAYQRIFVHSHPSPLNDFANSRHLRNFLLPWKSTYGFDPDPTFHFTILYEHQRLVEGQSNTSVIAPPTGERLCGNLIAVKTDVSRPKQGQTYEQVARVSEKLSARDIQFLTTMIRMTSGLYLKVIKQFYIRHPACDSNIPILLNLTPTIDSLVA